LGTPLPHLTPPPISFLGWGRETNLLLLGILGVGKGMGWAEVRGIWSARVCLGRCTWSLEGTKSHDRNEHLSFGKWGHKCFFKKGFFPFSLLQ